jgi:hypothetical protein
MMKNRNINKCSLTGWKIQLMMVDFFNKLLYVLQEFVNAISYARCINKRGTLQSFFVVALHLVFVLKIIAYGLEEGEKTNV